MREDFFDALSGYFFDKTVSDHTGEMNDYVFESKEAAQKMADEIGLSGVHSHKSGDGKTLWMPGKNMEEFQNWYEGHSEGYLTEDVRKDKKSKKYKKHLVYKPPSWKKNQVVEGPEADEDQGPSSGSYRYEDPKPGEVFTYKRKGIYRKNGTILVYKGKANDGQED